MRLRILLIAIALTIIICGAYFYLNRVPSIHWGEDARCMYSYASSTFIFSPKGAGTADGRLVQGRFRMTGVLNIRVMGIGGDEIRAALQFSPLQIKYKGKRDSEIEYLFSRLFYATFTTDGRIIGFEFSNEIAHEDRESIENAVRALQIIVPATVFSSWVSEEIDKHGLYASNYHYAKGLQKEKEKYLEVLDSKKQVNISDNIDIKRSIYECDYGYPDTWIRSLKGEELTVFYGSKGNVIARFSADLDLKKIPYDPDDNLAIWKDDLDFETEIAEWNKRPVEEQSISRKRELNSLKGRYGNIKIHKLIDTLFKKYSSFNISCVYELMDFLKLHPEAALQIPEYLLKEGLNADQRAMLINVLQNVKGDYAQKALVRIMEGDDFPGGSRVQSALALGDIEKPADGVIDSLWETYEGRSSDDKLSRRLSDTSMLSLGRIAGRLSKTNTEEYENVTYDIKSRIRSELSSAEDGGKLTTAIYAAGNTYDEDFIDPISDCFKSDTPMVRSAAAQSLALYKDENVETILTDELTRDDNINVRTSIVKAMHGRHVTDESIEKICEEIQIEDNDIVRGEMYRFLMKNRKRAGVRDTLRKMQKTERSLENRRIISRALASRK